MVRIQVPLPFKYQHLLFNEALPWKLPSTAGLFYFKRLVIMMRHIVIVVSVLAVLLLLVILAFGRSYLTVSLPLIKADVIVLLAGSYEERAPHAASLFSAGSADCIILTDDGVRRGWSRKHQRNLYSSERCTEELVQRGVPRQSIIALPFYKSGTVYDAIAVRQLRHKSQYRQHFVGNFKLPQPSLSLDFSARS